ncbi:MAG: HPr family phosphocarrier protein [Spirochaetes bacterium]|nr:HPr family phosphocarrier protein [Spirochaetota bacterium]
MSISCIVTIKNERGIHARPSSDIAKEALKYKSDIKIVYDGKEATAKDVLQIIMLELFEGTTVQVVAEGEDEKAALNAVKTLLKKKYCFE